MLAKTGSLVLSSAEGLDLSWSEEELPQRQRTKHVHGLHPYLGKFVPQLVEIFLRRHFQPGDVILDPFVGSGTTLVEANVLGMHAVGIDISQFNCLLSRVKTARYDLELLAREIEDIFDRVRTASEYAYSNGLLPRGTDIPQGLPPEDGIVLSELSTDNEYLNRWYARRSLQELLYYRSLIANYQYRDVLKIILSRAARSARQVPHYDLDYPSQPVRGPYYCHKHGRTCYPVGQALKFLKSYSFDTLARIRRYQRIRTEARVIVIHGDARQVEPPEGINGVFTSPPYLGLIDYHEQHRYAYELLGLEDHSELEIGAMARGRGQAAREDYVEGIVRVLRRCREHLKGDGPVIFVVNDKYGLYPEIMAQSGFVLEERITRQVNRRTGRRGAGFHEDVLIMRSVRG
ncbi:MAG: DNA methyltransferase [Anaerolineae bacterium]